MRFIWNMILKTISGVINDNNLDGEIMYVCGESFADPNNCYTVGGDLLWFLSLNLILLQMLSHQENLILYTDKQPIVF